LQVIILFAEILYGKGYLYIMLQFSQGNVTSFHTPTARAEDLALK